MFFCHCLTLSSHFKLVLISHSQAWVVHDKSHTGSHSKQKHTISITLTLGSRKEATPDDVPRPSQRLPTTSPHLLKKPKYICMKLQSAPIVEGGAQCAVLSTVRAGATLMTWRMFSLLICKDKSVCVFSCEYLCACMHV